jgi:sigma-B regulation protein RsbQ
VQRSTLSGIAAERGSFSAAARDLRILNASVSKQIAELERTLGVQLILHTTRQLNSHGHACGQLAHQRPQLTLNKNPNPNFIAGNASQLAPAHYSTRMSAKVNSGRQMTPISSTGPRTGSPGCRSPSCAPVPDPVANTGMPRRARSTSLVHRPEPLMNALRRNNVRTLGQGRRPMIFAHGFGCDQNMWRLVVPAFEDEFRIVLFDHVGHGRSDASAYQSAKYSTLDGYADDLLEICHELDLRNAIFVGHSVSAMIGVLAAIKEPERFDRLVLIGPSPCYINDGDYVGGFTRQDIEGLLDFLDSNYLGWSSSMAPTIMGNPDRPELADELTNSFCRTDPEIAKQFARVTFLSDNRADLPKLRSSTLILQCSDDAIAPEAVGHYMHQSLANSELVVMSATGHCPNLSAPEETIAAMRAFLERP